MGVAELDRLAPDDVDKLIIGLHNAVMAAHYSGAIAVGQGDDAAILREHRAVAVALRQWADVADWMVAKLEQQKREAA